VILDTPSPVVKNKNKKHQRSLQTPKLPCFSLLETGFDSSLQEVDNIYEEDDDNGGSKIVDDDGRDIYGK